MEDPHDVLRRRLYEPGSTAADVEAYRAAEAERVGSGDAAPAAGSRRRRLRAGTAALLLAVVVAAVAVVIALPMRPPSSGTATPPPGTIAVSAETRARFVAALDAERDPDLLGWLYGDPGARLAALLDEGRADSTEFTGTGPTTVTLSPTSEKERAGHLTVVLVVDRDLRFEWEATVAAPSNDRSGPEPAVAEHDGAARRGEPVGGTVGYGGGVPTRLTLLLPSGTRWAAVVVYSD